MKKRSSLILISILLVCLLVGGVQANAFSSWSAYGDAWKATNDTHTLIMWNTTGTRSPWLANGNTSTVDALVVAGGAIQPSPLHGQEVRRISRQPSPATSEPLIKFRAVGGGYPLGCTAVLNIAGSYEV